MALSSPKTLVHSISRSVLDLFFPRSCFISGSPLPANSSYRYIADSTLPGFHWARDPACYTCGVPFQGIVSGKRLCPNCIDLEPAFEHGKTVFLLKDAGRTLVHELKYRQGFHLWPDVAALLKENTALAPYLQGSILVPVPLHAKKFRKRGFNQSLLLAQTLAKLAPHCQVQNLLLRTKFTKTQTYLSKKDRKKNVKNAFALVSKSVMNNNSQYILVDDVFTTGATLNECAKVLKKYGASRVNIVTLGHG